jgi:hypothetical protein
MLLDDVLIAMTLGGLLLSAIYIYASFEEAWRRRDLERRRSDLIDWHATDREVELEGSSAAYKATEAEYP